MGLVTHFLHSTVLITEMAAQHQAFSKLQEYAAKVKDVGYDTESTDGALGYEARLNKSLKHLQDQVKQHEAASEKVALSTADIIRNHRLNPGS